MVLRTLELTQETHIRPMSYATAAHSDQPRGLVVKVSDY